jgi:long-chain acyl-CoA synthetase
VALNSETSIPAMLLSRVAAHGSEIVLRKKDRGIWTPVTWAELGERVRQVATSLQAAGFSSGDVACVVAETRPEWVAIDLGILAASGISVGVHPGENAEQLGHVLRESGARLLFVENEEQLDKVLLIRDTCARLQRIVILEMKGLRDFSDAMSESWQDFLARGAERDRERGEAWQAGIRAISADQPALLLFPHATTAGKGRVLTHGDAMRLVADAAEMLKPRAGDERLAVLPMSHVMERVLGVYFALHSRIVSNYLESPTTLEENLQELQPTVLGADPQTWERLYARASLAAAGATRLQGMFYRWAIRAGQSGGLAAGLARWLVLRAVRRELGLARLRLAYVGAAPVPPDVGRWAGALGISIRQIDGQKAQRDASEASYRALQEEAYST